MSWYPQSNTVGSFSRKFIGGDITIEERISQINAYSTPIIEDDKDLIKAIRSDPSVGFVIKGPPQGYFRDIKDVFLDGWDEDDEEFYRDTRRWSCSQSKDPECLITDTGADTYKFRDNHGYVVYFDNHQRKEGFYPLIQDDPHISEIPPNRDWEMNNVFHDKNEL